MSNVEEYCYFCQKQQYKYVCPKCGIKYCSVNCYKNAAHLKCSEEFYKTCIQEELRTTHPQSKDDMRKMYDILKRMREFDEGNQTVDFDDGLEEPLDSDDEEPTKSDEEEEEQDDDLVTRLQGININDADEVWQRLTANEREDFQKMVDSGDIMKLVPDYKPWWHKRQNPKIVVIEPKLKENKTEHSIPEIKENIPKFSDICTKSPSPCLHYNLWNILAAYACTVRFFGGEQVSNPSEATAHLVNLSSTLKYGTNFEDVNDALVSVEMEALTTGNGATGPKNLNGVLFIENREQLQNDARDIMFFRHYKLAALSDILNLLALTKKQLKSKNVEQAEFQKLYSLCSGSIELTSTRLRQLIKKFEFYLSYVNRESEDDLK